MISGITEYACAEDWPEINCIMKRLYTDFIVIEIGQDGKPLEACKTTKHKMEKQKQELGVEHGNEQKKEAAVNMAEEEACTQIPFEFESRNEEICKLAKGEIEQCTLDLKQFGKDVRKKLYQFLAHAYGQALFTRCENGQLTISRSRGEDGGNESRKRRHWPAERGDYLHFTMAKENLDTHAALNLMARKLRVKPSMFSVSGTKDRRAVSVQRVCVYRMEQTRLTNLHLRGIWLSDFCYSNTKLKLGQANGNHFSIILRDIHPSFDESQFNGRIESWRRVGFLNYFGSQRFGACGVNTAEIGRLALAEKWKEAVQALLAPREGTKAINNALKHFAKGGDANEALELLPAEDYSVHIERSLLSTLAKGPTLYKVAILALPRDVRTLYIHAYQSSVFNRIVSRRKKMFGMALLPGDLDSEGNPIERIDEADIGQVCLPLPSLGSTKLPQNEVGRWYGELAEADGVDGDAFQRLERQFAIGSVYRPFVVRPGHITWELLDYSAHTEPLAHCAFVPPRPERGEEPQQPNVEEQEQQKACRKALKVEFDLPPGTYATTALRELMRVDFGKQSQKALEEEARQQPKNCCE